MTAALTFEQRVAMCSAYVAEKTDGELSVTPCLDEGFMTIRYHGKQLIVLDARGWSGRRMVQEITALYRACVMFKLVDMQREFQE